MKVGIIGYGEIGSSLAKVYNDFPQFEVLVVDPAVGFTDDLTGVEIINICIHGFFSLFINYTINI